MCHSLPVYIYKMSLLLSIYIIFNLQTVNVFISQLGDVFIPLVTSLLFRLRAGLVRKLRQRSKLKSTMMCLPKPKLWKLSRRRECPSWSWTRSTGVIHHSTMITGTAPVSLIYNKMYRYCSETRSLKGCSSDVLHGLNRDTFEINDCMCTQYIPRFL